MMSDLPNDLLEEILSRVPATALRRLRSTCKRWDALFKDQRFTKKHFDKAPKHNLALMLNERRVSSLSVNLHGIDDDNNIAAPCIEFKGEFSLKDPLSSPSSEQLDIFRVFHCDGLLLCNTKYDDRLVIWNPCTGETMFIILSNRDSKYSKFALGYENNKSSSCRNYKLLSHRNDGAHNHLVEIYDFTTGSWRFLNVMSANFSTRTGGVSLKGNTYWIGDNNSLLSFDFSTETFGRMCLPNPSSSCYTTVLSTVRDEKLSVLHNNFDSLMTEIYVTTNDKIDHNVVLSWRKLFSINLYCLFSRHGFSSCVSFVFDEEMNVVVFCGSRWEGHTIKNKVCVIGEHGVYKEMPFGEPISKSERAIIFNYVPSLVQIQQEETLN